MQRKFVLFALSALLLTATVAAALAKDAAGGGQGSASRGHDADSAAAHSQALDHMGERGRENTNAQFLEQSKRDHERGGLATEDIGNGNGGRSAHGENAVRLDEKGRARANR